MNVKIHTPKSLKMGSGMATLKQFLLSLVATTISIVLTFGTAAWLDDKKKEEARREMVMMILYDLAGSIEQAEQCDSMLREGFKLQLAVAENPKLLSENPFLFVKTTPYVNYTETVERIFSTNIETINTLGNVLFAENVSDIYRLRRQYKQDISDKYMAEFELADARKDFMGLTTWTGAVPKKTDAEIAKNYLSQGRGYDAGRIVSLYLSGLCRVAG